MHRIQAASEGNKDTNTYYTTDITRFDSQIFVRSSTIQNCAKISIQIVTSQLDIQIFEEEVYQKYTNKVLSRIIFKATNIY